MSWIISLVVSRITRRPKLMLAITGLALRLRPVWSFGRTLVALRPDQIRKVLTNTDRYEIGPVTGPTILTGDFVLGMDEFPKYKRDKDILRQVLNASEKKILAKVSADVCAAQLAWLIDEIEARQGNVPAAPVEIDLAREFAEPIVTKFVLAFFLGLDAPPNVTSQIFATGRRGQVLDDERLIFAQWLRKVGSIIVTGSPAPFGLQRIAEDAEKELGRWLRDLIRERIRSGPGDVAGNVLDGLIGEYAKVLADDRRTELLVEEVYRNVGGLMLAGSTPLIKSFVLAFDELLDHLPELSERLDTFVPISGDVGMDTEFNSAIAWFHSMPTKRPGAEESAHVFPPRMLLSPRSGEDRRDRADKEKAKKVFKQLVYEAMRFSPTFPLLARFCPHREFLSDGLDGRQVVREGSTVIVSPLAAMHDPEEFPDSELFGYRPMDAYMHFGFGGHTCLGKSIATEVITDMIMHIFEIPDIELGKRLSMVYDGPAIESYVIEAAPELREQP